MYRGELIKSAVLAIAVTLGFALSAFAADKPFFEENTERWGSDYSIIELRSGGAQACHNACVKDKQCLSFTWHRPGTKGKYGQCHLKSKVPHGRQDPCCVSGVLTGSQEKGTGPSAMSSPSDARKLAKAQKEAEDMYREAKATQGQSIGLPELKAAAYNPPMRIAPVDYTKSEY